MQNLVPAFHLGLSIMISMIVRLGLFLLFTHPRRYCKRSLKFDEDRVHLANFFASFGETGTFANNPCVTKGQAAKIEQNQPEQLEQACATLISEPLKSLTAAATAFEPLVHIITLFSSENDKEDCGEVAAQTASIKSTIPSLQDVIVPEHKKRDEESYKVDTEDIGLAVAVLSDAVLSEVKDHNKDHEAKIEKIERAVPNLLDSATLKVEVINDENDKFETAKVEAAVIALGVTRPFDIEDILEGNEVQSEGTESASYSHYDNSLPDSQLSDDEKEVCCAYFLGPAEPTSPVCQLSHLPTPISQLGTESSVINLCGSRSYEAELSDNSEKREEEYSEISSDLSSRDLPVTPTRPPMHNPYRATPLHDVWEYLPTLPSSVLFNDDISDTYENDEEEECRWESMSAISISVVQSRIPKLATARSPVTPARHQSVQQVGESSSSTRAVAATPRASASGKQAPGKRSWTRRRPTNAPEIFTSALHVPVRNTTWIPVYQDADLPLLVVSPRTPGGKIPVLKTPPGKYRSVKEFCSETNKDKSEDTQSEDTQSEDTQSENENAMNQCKKEGKNTAKKPHGKNGGYKKNQRRDKGKGKAVVRN